jgi:23S rRNA (uracil1939-C5)-methyltransferase
MSTSARLTIERLGQRGEGVAKHDGAAVFVPYALPGETVLAEVDRGQGRLVEIVTPSPERVPAFCRYFTQCGGCAVQTLATAAYREWKRGLVAHALHRAGIAAEVGPLVDAHGEGRRRATFHGRIARDAHGRARAETGFMRARAHEIIEIEACPLLAPAMAGALAAARGLAAALVATGRTLDIVVTATEGGLDVDLHGTGALGPDARTTLIAAAERFDLARLANHGETIVERRTPFLVMGRAEVAPPPGAFLQATVAGEEQLAALVYAAVGPARRVVDLFAGIGTFALRLAESAEVHAVEGDAAALAALDRAARNATLLRPVTVERRDLFRRPLAGGELERFDAAVFDPPRAGAEMQARALAAANLATLAAVSCNAQTFARDARILAEAGYRLASVTPIDQFRHSQHVEIVGVFRRAAERGRSRRLLG